MELKQINNIQVRPIQSGGATGGGKSDKIPKLGLDLFADPYCNIFVSAKKKSGKTNLIGVILDKCSNKHTIIVVFSSTIEKDTTWVRILKQPMLAKLQKKDQILTYKSIHEENDTGEPALSYVIDNLSQPEEEDEHKLNYILVFDDISAELRDKSIETLMKKNRHYKMKIIISSQYMNDLTPAALMQLDYLLMFGGHNDDKLKHIYDKIDLSISFDQFKKIYEVVTSKRYQFLYVDIRNEDFRKNFNYAISRYKATDMN